MHGADRRVVTAARECYARRVQLRRLAKAVLVALAFPLVASACASANHAPGVETVRLKCTIATNGYLRDCTPLDGVSEARAADLETELRSFRQKPILVDGRAVEVRAIITLNLQSPLDGGADAEH